MTTTDRVQSEFAERHMHTILARLAGPSAVPRVDQVDAVHAVLQPASRVLVVQATGWGKSAVYWAATHAIRSTGDGPTLVVSPLLALMRDQVSAAERAGLKAATVNSTNIDDWDEVFQQLDADAIDVLLAEDTALGALVNHVLVPDSTPRPAPPHAAAAREWEDLEGFVESRLRRE